MIDVLLDTHALIWAIVKPARLSRVAAGIIHDVKSRIYVSAASAWEIATKVRLGKLNEADELVKSFEQVVPQAGYIFLPVDVNVALRAGRLVGVNGDPFDRMVAAQALAMDIPVISIDPKLDAFGIRRIW